MLTTTHYALQQPQPNDVVDLVDLITNNTNTIDGQMYANAQAAAAAQALANTSVQQSSVGHANGVASLDANGLVPVTQIPALSYIPASAEGAVNGVATLDANAHVPASQLANAVLASQVGAANGVASLDATGKVPTAQIPSLSYIPTSAEGSASGVATLDSNSHVVQTANNATNATQWNGAKRTSGTTAPSNPNPGDEWYNTSTNRKLYYNGTAWVDPLQYQ